MSKPAFTLRYPGAKPVSSRISLQSVGGLVQALKMEPTPTLLVTDKKVAQLQAPLLAKLKVKKCISDVVVLPRGEKAKTFVQLQRVLDQAQKMKLPRQGRILALGGGCVGDLAGFAAATHLRGIAFWNAPTTLLAMVDSSVGGKVAINSDQGKNLVGAFHQPEQVFVDPTLLSTLPRAQVLSGWAEMLKTALLFSSPWWSRLAKVVDPCGLESEVMGLHILTSLKAKGKVVLQDEKEQGKRALLNLGHTVAHGLEHHSNYRLSHGAAVGAGLMLETRLARLLGICSLPTEKKIVSVLKTLRYAKPLVGLKAEDLLEPMTRDKKATSKKIPFVFLKAIGQPAKADRGWVFHLPPGRTKTLLNRALKEGF